MLCKKLSKGKSEIEAYTQLILHEFIDEMKADRTAFGKQTYLQCKPTKDNYHINDFVHPNDDNCAMLKDETITYGYNGYDNLLPLICLHY